MNQNELNKLRQKIKQSKLLRLKYMIKNWYYLLRGYTLYNYGVSLKWDWSKRKQITTNPNRKRPYTLDDPGWEIIKYSNK